MVANHIFLSEKPHTTLPDIVHSEPWHLLTIQSMCFDCSAGSGSWSKWITLFPLFSLPVYWWNPFTSEANSSRTPPPLRTHTHTHTPHPQHSSLKDSHCQSVPPTPSCYTHKVNMFRRCIEKVITGAFLRCVSQRLYVKPKAVVCFIPHQWAAFIHRSSRACQDPWVHVYIRLCAYVQLIMFMSGLVIGGDFFIHFFL